MKNIDQLDIENLKSAAYKSQWTALTGQAASGSVTLNLPGFAGSMFLKAQGASVQASFSEAYPLYIDTLLQNGWLDRSGCLLSAKDDEYLVAFFRAAAILSKGNTIPLAPQEILLSTSEVPELAAARMEALSAAGGAENYRTEALREALDRVGQDLFRKKLDERWHNRCAVTGVSIREVLRASHIKPWAASSDRERLDPNNGLLLCANLDALFDKGLISFHTDGKILISSVLPEADRFPLGLSLNMRLKEINPDQEKYMLYHRKYIYQR